MTFQDPPAAAPDKPPAGAYIHIPFCLKKCSYCDFYSITDPSLQPLFADALISEMNMIGRTGLAYDSLYIGGGTPSVLDDVVLRKIIDAAGQCFHILPDAETTLEVNPGTVTLKQLKNYRQAAVNRISIGIQSFNPINLGFLGRIHSATEAETAVNWAQEAGFENIGLDLIYGIPGQTDESWRKDLQTAVKLRPQHLSCYMLSYEPGTPMHMDLQNQAFKRLSEQQVCKLYETAVTFLSDHHYVQYETSNFAQETSGSRGTQTALAHASRHNMKYWNFAPYIGLGPSAHSFMDQKRFWNYPSVEKYIEELSAGRLPRAGVEVLNREQQWIEAVYLGLRQTRGIAVDAIDKKFGVNFKTHYDGVIADLEEKGLMTSCMDRCALTSKGMLYLDAIAAMFI
jgi:putative oxygen-independent coproporphyrinogen III oxidase